MRTCYHYPVWQSSDGPIPIDMMSDRHLRNAVSSCVRYAHRRQRDLLMGRCHNATPLAERMSSLKWLKFHDEDFASLISEANLRGLYWSFDLDSLGVKRDPVVEILDDLIDRYHKANTTVNRVLLSEIYRNYCERFPQADPYRS